MKKTALFLISISLAVVVAGCSSTTSVTPVSPNVTNVSPYITATATATATPTPRTTM